MHETSSSNQFFVLFVCVWWCLYTVRTVCQLAPQVLLPLGSRTACTQVGHGDEGVAQQCWATPRCRTVQQGGTCCWSPAREEVRRTIKLRRQRARASAPLASHPLACRACRWNTLTLGGDPRPPPTAFGAGSRLLAGSLTELPLRTRTPHDMSRSKPTCR
jgi:hypothetical protein